MKITEQAANEFKKAIEEFDSPGAGIRIFNGRSCCGPTIQMDLSNKPAKNEVVLNIEEIDFFLEKDLLETLSPVTIEFGAGGFRFTGFKRSGSCCS